MNTISIFTHGRLRSHLNILKLFLSNFHVHSHAPTFQGFETRYFSSETEPSKHELLSTTTILHPWPEWVGLMETLLKLGYFNADGNPFCNQVLSPKESNSIRTACLNFARDRYHIMRYLSSKHIKVIAECGCPSTDRKVVNSAKRLRAYLGIDEGNVCSSCNLRGDCERAFVMAREDEGGRTVDVMRVVLTYGLDPTFGTVENKPCLNKAVKESVRALLQQMIEHGSDFLKPTQGGGPSLCSESQEKARVSAPMKQGDWLCPKCNFMNFSRNIKCLRCDSFSEEKLKQLQEDNDHLPLKKGDWICEKCNFLNFAKNTRCLQCKEKPPKRQLNPGEWECDSCNYINFRRNSICLKCDHRRPKASNFPSTCTQPEKENEKGDYTKQHGGMDYGNSLRKQVRGRAWRFLEGESEVQEQSISGNEVPGWVDFPISGGKSDLSRDPQKREEWKLKMLERNQSIREERESSNRLWFSGNRISKESGSDDDDDENMAEWFGHKNG